MPRSRWSAAASIRSSEQLELIAALAAGGRIDIESPVAVRELLAVKMQQVPAVSAVGFATLDLQLHRAVREPDGTIERETLSLVNQPQGMERFRQLQTAQHTFWGALFWSETIKQPVVNVRTPVRRIDNAFIGGLIATVAVGDLSYLIGDPKTGGDGRYFIPGRPRPRAGGTPADRTHAPSASRRSGRCDHQGGGRPCPRQDLGSAGAHPADRPRAGFSRSRRRGGLAAPGSSSIASFIASGRSPGWSDSISRSRMRRATSTG